MAEVNSSSAVVAQWESWALFLGAQNNAQGDWCWAPNFHNFVNVKSTCCVYEEQQHRCQWANQNKGWGSRACVREWVVALAFVTIRVFPSSFGRHGMERRQKDFRLSDHNLSSWPSVVLIYSFFKRIIEISGWPIFTKNYLVTRTSMVARRALYASCQQNPGVSGARATELSTPEKLYFYLGYYFGPDRLIVFYCKGMHHFLA
jgi:hypothetical protein